ncbi:MAG: hypothetical protein WCD35_16170, partial [Mycobacteriales bacterium]
MTLSTVSGAPEALPPVVGRRMRRHVRIAVALSVGIAVMVLAAWATDLRGLYAAPPSHQAMVPVTAVLVLLLALAVALGRRWPAVVAALSVLALALWVLASHHGPLTFPPSRLLFYDKVVEGSWRAALPSVVAAVA